MLRSCDYSISAALCFSVVAIVQRIPAAIWASHLFRTLVAVLCAITFALLTISTAEAWPDCRMVVSRKERATCLKDQRAHRQPQAGSSRAQMENDIDRMKRENDRLNRRFRASAAVADPATPAIFTVRQLEAARTTTPSIGMVQELEVCDARIRRGSFSCDVVCG